MKVDLHYAETHLADLITAADNREVVEIEREHKPSLRLIVGNTPDRSGKPSLLGIGKGQIWITDDFDSPEVNDLIADGFEGITR